MSGAGTPAEELSRTLNAHSAAGKKIAIVAASWHAEIVEAMVERAVSELERVGTSQIAIYRVPGSFEIPVMVANLVEKFDGFITLGLVLRGETAHCAVRPLILSTSARELHRASLRFHSPPRSQSHSAC